MSKCQKQQRKQTAQQDQTWKQTEHKAHTASYQITLTKPEFWMALHQKTHHSECKGASVCLASMHIKCDKVLEKQGSEHNNLRITHS